MWLWFTFKKEKKRKKKRKIEAAHEKVVFYWFIMGSSFLESRKSASLIILSWSNCSQTSFSIAITASWWSLHWPIVLLSQVWRWRRALKDLLHVQLLTGTVRVTWMTDFSDEIMSESNRLHTEIMSRGAEPACFLHVKKCLAIMTSSTIRSML